MHKGFFLFSAVLLVGQPVFAADQPSKAERDRQMSEIVFQNYPPRALAAGEEGPVFFTVTLDKDAHPTRCEVTHGSGHPLLDEETCDLIVQHAVFGKSRDEHGNLLQVAEGVVNWTLPGHTPAPINMSAVATTSKPEPQICKKTVRVGTLASFERTCMTPSQWAKQSDEMKQPWKDSQAKGTGCGLEVNAIADPGPVMRGAANDPYVASCPRGE
jgi:TonB family protein